MKQGYMAKGTIILQDHMIWHLLLAALPGHLCLTLLYIHALTRLGREEEKNNIENLGVAVQQ